MSGYRPTDLGFVYRHNGENIQYLTKLEPRKRWKTRQVGETGLGNIVIPYSEYEKLQTMSTRFVIWHRE